MALTEAQKEKIMIGVNTAQRKALDIITKLDKSNKLDSRLMQQLLNQIGYMQQGAYMLTRK